MDSRLIALQRIVRGNHEEIELCLPPPTKLDPIASQMLQQSTFLHFLPCQRTEENGKHQFFYKAEGTAFLLSDLEWNLSTLHQIVGEILCALDEAEDHLIPTSRILWQSDALYFSKDQHLLFILCPAELHEEPLDLSSFFFTLLESLPWQGEGDLSCFPTCMNALQQRPFGKSQLQNLYQKLQAALQNPFGVATAEVSSSKGWLSVEKKKTGSEDLSISKSKEKEEQENSLFLNDSDVASLPNMEELSSKEEIRWLENREDQKCTEGNNRSTHPNQTKVILHAEQETKESQQDSETEKISLMDLFTRFSFANLRKYQDQRKSAKSREKADILWEERGQFNFRGKEKKNGVRLRFAHQEFSVDHYPICIGRKENADVQLTGHDVSMEHAKIVVVNGRYYLVDCFSTNGTWLNNERLIGMENRELHTGDRIRFGREEAIFFSGSYH